MNPLLNKTTLTAVISGSFDPVTIGHLDIIRRTAQIFPQVVVLVANNPSKHYWFNPTQRQALITASLQELEVKNVTVIATSGLLMHWCEQNLGEKVVFVKGVRNSSDYDYETTQAIAHTALGKIETLLLPANPTQTYISSSLVKELVKHGGNIETLVSKPVFKAIQSKLETN